MKKAFSTRTIILASSLLLQLIILCFQSRGAPGDVDLSFDPGSGVNGPVNAVVVQGDGKVIIGGEFTTVKGLTRSRIARLNADGSGDSSFSPSGGGLGSVYSVARQTDGKVLVGHDYGITRLNSDGSLDTNFTANLVDFLELGVTPVKTIAVQPDGQVLIGGEFATTTNGSNWNFGVARLQSDGGLDTFFNPGTAWSYSPLSLAWQPDGKVLIGGGMGISRLNANGSADNSFNPGSIVIGFVYSVVLQPDGKVLIGGDFTAVNGTNRNRIARLNANGSLDSSFNPGAGADHAGVTSVCIQSDGKVLIGGGFNNVNGTNRNGIARLNANGGLDASFNPGTGANGIVSSIALHSNGQAFISGAFTTVNATNRNRIARLNADGSLDVSFNPGSQAPSSVASLIVQTDGKVLIGGAFLSGDGLSSAGMITRLNANGSGDATFNPAIASNPYSLVSSLALQSDGKVLVGGVNSINAIIRLNANGSPDSGFLPQLSIPVLYPAGCPGDRQCSDNTNVYSLAAQADGKVLVGGTYYHYDVQEEGQILNWFSRIFLAQISADGSRDTNFNVDIHTSFYSPTLTLGAVVVQPDGKVLVTGSFDAVNGTNRNGFARLNANGSLDTSFNPAIGGYRIALQPDGKVLIGGSARLNADGTLDGSFNPGTGANGGAYSIALQPDGKILIGGGFTMVNGTSRNRIARLNADGSLDNSFNPGTGADGIVRSIALQPDGNVLIGGDFLTVNDVVRPYVARLFGDSVAASLNIVRSNAFVILSWPVTGLDFQLQETSDLSLLNSWSSVAQPAVTNAGQVFVAVPTTVERKFFRLKSE